MKTVYSGLIKDCLPVSCTVRGDAAFPALAPVIKCGGAPSGVKYAQRFASGTFVIKCADGSIYASADGENFSYLAELDGGIFGVTDIKDGVARDLLICKDTAYNLSGENISLPREYVCGVMHRGRLLASDGVSGKLYWSGFGEADDNKNSLSGAGYADLSQRGGILGILNFGGKAAVVQKYGITLFSASGAPEDFSVMQTDTDTDEVIAGTARIAGGKLIFFTKSGLKVCDGNTVKPVRHRCENDVYSPYCSCAEGNLYFAGVNSRRLGKAVLVYDACEGGSYLIDVAADAMCAGGGVYIFCADKVYFLQKGTKVRFFCDGSFGYGGKTLTALRAEGKAEQVVAVSGNMRHAFAFMRGTAHMRIRGESFSLEITGGGEIRNLSAEAANGI